MGTYIFTGKTVENVFLKWKDILFEINIYITLLWNESLGVMEKVVTLDEM